MPRMMWPHLRHPREVSTMVETQVRRWALRQKGHPSAFLQTWPVVTISHEAEEQGIALGRTVADALGFGYWDRDLVLELARLLDPNTGNGDALDERTRDAIEEFLGTSLPSRDIVSADYTDLVRRIVDSIAHHGGTVFVGRGAQFLVAPRDSLRVRLVAPFDLRARTLEASKGITFEAAKQAIQVGDNERAAFVLHALGHDVADPAHFDLVVNSETYAREAAAGLVLMAYFAKFGQWPLTAHGLMAGRMPGRAPALPSVASVSQGTPVTGGWA